APPGGNVSAPINVSNTSQTKTGFLWVDGGLGSMSGGYFGGGIIIGNTSVTDPGTIRFDGADFLGYDGTEWKSLTTGTVVTGTPPTVNISASPTIIATGQSTTLSWTSTDAIACAASGGWSGGKAISGSEVISPASSVTSTLTCNNAFGSGVDSVAVDVRQWANTTGEGNPGESCNAWLTRTGQTGVNGSGTRAYDSSYTFNNYCVYRMVSNQGQWVYPSTWSSSSYRPVNVGTGCLESDIGYSCGYVGYKTQTRR
ncbi:MAG: hypothetical protein NUV40_01965, partial [Patescibacteria group bacterium]|nr:hypothetical protein [Patescibacteria group bacterium]